MEQIAKMRLVTPQRTPRLRFPEFSRNWEKKKLGEVLIDLYNGQTPSRSRLDFWNGNINWLSSGELNRGVICKTAEKITKAGQQDAHLRIIPAGTFVIAITGLEAAGTRGNCAILGLDTTVNQSCMALFPDDKKLNVTFLFKWYEKVGERYGIIYTQGTKQQSYNANIIKKMEIFLPSLPEQEKIADFFTALDEKINAKEKEIEEVKTLKKGFLQQLFPQEGETVPRLRFTGFSGAWEKKKLGEIAKIIGGGTPKTNVKEYWNGNINWYSPVEIGNSIYVSNSQRKITKEGLKNSSATILPANKTILFTSRAGIGSMAILKTPGATNQGFQSIVVNDDIAPYFIYSAGDIIKRKAKKVASGSTFLEISHKNMEELEIYIPSLPEQEKIADFFSTMDEKIEAMKQQRDALKAMKKGFLQQMFI